MISFICFSKNRPLQLHAYLNSLYEHIDGASSVHVIVKASNEYISAYNDVQLLFPSVEFVYEYDFRGQLAELIKESEYICFGCDDVIFTSPFETNEIENLLVDTDILGVSLRLGTHTTHNMFWHPVPQPTFALTGANNEFITWDIGQGQWDWGYPWEVLGTIYRAEFVRSVVGSIVAFSPSQLENLGSQIWANHTSATKLAAYRDSRLVVPTVNVVQNEFPNGICGDKSMEPEFLLACWHNNLRVDVLRYENLQTGSWRIGNFFLTRV